MQIFTVRSLIHAVVPSLILFLGVTNASAADEQWWAGFAWPGPGLDGSANHLTVYNGKLVVSGSFNRAGGVPITDYLTTFNSLAEWDGLSWAPMGTPPQGFVSTFFEYDGKLLAGGGFNATPTQPATGIMEWDGLTWGPFEDGNGPGPHSYTVGSLALYDGSLIASGIIGGEYGVFKWDGSTWTLLGLVSDFGSGRYATSMLEYDGKLIVAGDFDTVGGVAAYGLAEWDGATWSSMGNGISGPRCLALYGGKLIAAGTFSTAGDTAASDVAQWDGFNWSPVGTGITSACCGVYDLSVWNGMLVAVGIFEEAGGNPADGVAVWDGNTWSSPVSYVYGDCMSAEVLGTDLVIGGEFYSVDGVEASGVARWDGSTWSALDPRSERPGEGLSNPPRAMLERNGELIVGGDFGRAGTSAGGKLARWSGSAWAPLGNEIENVTSLAEFKGDLIVAGLFTSDSTFYRLARWDGNEWNVVETPFISSPICMAPTLDTLYVGTATQGVFSWDGATWNALGGGGVNDLEVFDGRLIAARSSVLGINAWNGTSWETIGSLGGVSGTPQGLALGVFDGNLIAGGRFKTINGVPADYLAAWNGATWAPLPGGPDSTVRAMTSYDGKLAVGGDFQQAGTIEASRVALWDGGTWSSFDSGVNGSVRVLNAYQGDLYVGGNFSLAGHKASSFIARWMGGPVAVRLDSFTAEREGSGIVLRWRLADESLDQVGFSVHREEDGGNRLKLTPSLMTGSRTYTFRDTDPPASETRYWLAEWDRSGTVTWFGPLRVAAASNGVTQLLRVFPNPFQSGAEIALRTAIAGSVTLSIYDLQGRRVVAPREELLPAGDHVLRWDGKDETGALVGRGSYFLRLEVPGAVFYRKLMKQSGGR